MARRKKSEREKELDALVDQLLEGERPQDLPNFRGQPQCIRLRALT